jgi:hypothetical protein
MAKRVYRKTYRAHGDLPAFLEKACAYQGDECLLWPYGRTAKGYARIGAKNFGTVLVARIVCKRVHGEPPTPKHDSAHSCGNGHLGCVTPKHIRWATRSENYADSVEHGTASRGERNGRAKLTWKLVEQIRKSRGSQRLLAAKFNVDQRTVGRILRREIWREPNG